MAAKTNGVSRMTGSPGVLDAMDRKLLGLLALNAEHSYSELSALLNLSPPAVHERVKRLKREGVIKGTVAVLDGPKVGRPLLAFVHLETTDWESTRRVLAVSDFPEVEEIHTVAGDTAMILKVRTAGAASLESFLGAIHRLEGFTKIKTYVALGTYLERGPFPA